MIRYVFFTLSFLASAAYSVAQTAFDKIFVSQEWLEKNSEQLNIVLLHVGSEEDYNTSHIKGAQLINLRWEIPSLEDFQETLERHGVTDESVNILYYGSGVFAPTFRLYFTMKYFGLSRNTFILDGGLPGWIARNKPVSIAASPAVAVWDELFTAEL